MTDASPSHRLLSGRYELHRRIARGGMADVFLARDQLLDRPVAVKILFPQYAAEPSFVARFRREAQAAANLNHPSVVAVYDWGSHEDTYFIVMEYVEGRSLADVLSAEGHLHPDRAAEIATDVAAALGFAHRNGTVHRDVKPGNIMITPNGQVKVADFGIARAFGGGDDELTQTGSVMGTASYFSPEQAQGKPVDPRSDLYSLGIVLFEMVTGDPPFSGASPVSIAYKHVQEPAPSASSRNPSVPRPLDAVISKLLAKDPDDRYAAAEDVRGDLRRFREGHPLNGVTVAPEQSASQPSPEQVAAANAAMTAAMAAAPPMTQQPPMGQQPPMVQPQVGQPQMGQPQMGQPQMVPGGQPHMGQPPMGQPPMGASTQMYQGQMYDTQSRAIIDTSRAMPASAAVNQHETVEEYYEPPSRTGVFVVLLAGLLLLLIGLIFFLTDRIGQETANDDTGEAVMVAVPDVIGQDQRSATQLLEAEGFEVDATFAPSDTDPNLVFEQNPAPGTEYNEGGIVQIVISEAEQTVQVPNVVDRTEQQAAEELDRLGFGIEIKRETDDVFEEGRVISQSLMPGDPANPGSEITIVVSLGPEQREIPNLAGKTSNEANLELGQAGFSRVNIERRSDDSVPADTIIETQPPAGTKVNLDSLIVLVVSSGQNEAQVPRLAGLTQAQAEQLLTDNRFTPRVEFVDVDAASGNIDRVISQTPDADAILATGQEVIIRIGRLPQVTTAPATTQPPTSSTADTTDTTAPTSSTDDSTEP